MPSHPTADQRDAHWRQQSLAAVAMVHLDRTDPVWRLLRHSPDPSLRSFLIHHLGKLQAGHEVLATRLQVETDVSIRRALIQVLGGLRQTLIPADERTQMVETLQQLRRSDPDAGIHAAAEWVLRRWDVALEELATDEPEPTDEQREHLAKLVVDFEQAKQAIAVAEQMRSTRQAAWERQMLEQATPLLDSLSDGLIAHFPLDEVAGREIADAVTGQTPGIYQGTTDPEWAPGIVGQALRLDGNGCFDCGNDFQVDNTDAVSYGCWFLKQGGRKVMTLIGKMDISLKQRGFDLTLNADRANVHFSHAWTSSVGNMIHIDALIDANDGKWHHVFVTNDGSGKARGVRFYSNGTSVPVRIGADALEGSLQTSVPLCIGARNLEKGNPFHGLLDDVRIYNRCLTEEEVRQLYQMGIHALARLPVDERSPEVRVLLAETYGPEDALVGQLQEQLTAAESALQLFQLDGIRRWFVNSQGQTMVVIPHSGEMESGGITHTFAIAAHEVTADQFRRFHEDYVGKTGDAAMESVPGDGPAGRINWYDAAAYCNWLSAQESIPPDQWCYAPNSNDRFAAGMTINPDYLRLNGYRLPNEAEWERACRAKSRSDYSFGEPVELLANYAFFGGRDSREFPVGWLRPNEFGLFDMHGGLKEWCQDAIGRNESAIVTKEDTRMLRGGSFLHPNTLMRSASRNRGIPSNRSINSGFRPARTYPLSH